MPSAVSRCPYKGGESIHAEPKFDRRPDGCSAHRESSQVISSDTGKASQMPVMPRTMDRTNAETVMERNPRDRAMTEERYPFPTAL